MLIDKDCVRKIGLALCILLGTSQFVEGASGSTNLVYPKTKKVEQIDNYFGTQISDPYRWLEDDNAQDTKAWVEEQNKLTFGYLENIPYRKQVLARIKNLVNYAR